VTCHPDWPKHNPPGTAEYELQLALDQARQDEDSTAALADRASQLEERLRRLAVQGPPATTADGAAKPLRLVFILAGQSNMAGRGAVPDTADASAADASAADAQIRCFAQRGDVWQTAVDPLHADKPSKAGVGPGLPFARELRRRLLAAGLADASVLLVPCAWGGTAIRHWLLGGPPFGPSEPPVLHSPGGANQDGRAQPPTGSDFAPSLAASVPGRSTNVQLFDECVRRVRLALQTAGDGAELAGLLWHQGESDCAAGGQSAEAHPDATAAAIQALRAAVGAPLLPAVVGELGYFLDQADPRFAIAPTVNAGIVSLPRRLHRCACVSAQGLDHRGDRLHFSAAAARALGVRYAEAWLRLYGVGLVHAQNATAHQALYSLGSDPAPFCFPVGSPDPRLLAPPSPASCHSQRGTGTGQDKAVRQVGGRPKTEAVLD
jgi:hypothetical protein